MKKQKKWLTGMSVLAIAGLLVGCEAADNQDSGMGSSSEVKKENHDAHVKTHEETTKKQEKDKALADANQNAVIPFGILGQNVFSKEEKYKGTPYTWGAEIPADTEFVLISKDEIMTPEKKEFIKSLVAQKKTVFLVGKDVTFEQAKETFGYEISGIELKSNLPFSFLTFGYGYSEEDKKNMPLFYGTNLDDVAESDMNTVVNEIVYEYLRELKYPVNNADETNSYSSSELNK